LPASSKWSARGNEERVAGRQRARFYKDRGYDIQYVDLTGKG
jgi:hypothetical protein